MKDASSNESGNVLFLILVAVVLFAALTFAITMSGRSGGDASRDTTQIIAAQIIQNATDTGSAVLRLRLSSGIAPEGISFEAVGLPDHVNPGCATEDCRVFSPQGGKTTYVRPQMDWLVGDFAAQPFYGHWIHTSATCIPGVGSGEQSPCDGSPEHMDLIAVLPWINRDICMALNVRLGLTERGVAPPKLSGAAWTSPPDFTGTFGTGGVIADSGSVLYGEEEGCFEGNGTPPDGSYHYYRVMVAR